MRTLSGCFCYCVGTGALVFGWMGVDSGVLFMISGMASAKNYDTTNLAASGTSYKTYRLQADWAMTALSGNAALELIVNGALFFGANKGNKCFLLPWLLLRAIFIILVFFVFIMHIVGASHGVKVDTLVFVISLPLLLFLIYFWLVILSLYVKLDGNLNLSGRILEMIKLRLHRDDGNQSQCPKVDV